MTVYIDKDYKCHVEHAEGLTAVEDPFFDGKCAAFIEGYCYKNDGRTTAIYPWRPIQELKAAQSQYARDMEELRKAYAEGVNSAYDQ